MTEWDITITYDVPYPGEDVAARLLGGTVATAGRSPWSDRLTITMHLHGGPWSLDDCVQAATTVTMSMLETAGIADRVYGGAPAPVAVECITAEESERRTPEPAPLPAKWMTSGGVAEALGISDSAVRKAARAGAPQWDAQQLDDGTWVFSRAAVMADARRRRQLADAGLVDAVDPS